MGRLGKPLPPIRSAAVLEAFRLALGERAVKDCHGLAVDIMTPRDMPVHPSTLVSPKDDGESRFFLFGQPRVRTGIDLHFIDRAMRVFDAGNVPVPVRKPTKAAPDPNLVPRPPPRQLSFVLDGEFHEGDMTFRVFDVLMYKGKPCVPTRPFLERYKFAVPVLRVFPRGKVGLAGARITVSMKPFYGASATAHVHDMCEEGLFPFPTDGLVFQDAHRPRARPKKFKPVERVTCDFVLRHNRQLMLDAGYGRLVFVDCVDQAQRSQVADKVVECKYVVDAEPIEPAPDSILPSGRWEIVRERPDKAGANHVSVYDRNACLIAEGFTFQKLLDGLLRHRGVCGARARGKSKIPTPCARGDRVRGGGVAGHAVEVSLGGYEGGGDGERAADTAAAGGSRKHARFDADGSRESAHEDHSCTHTRSVGGAALTDGGRGGYFARDAVARKRSLSVRMKGAHGAVKDLGCYKAYAGDVGVTDVLELGVGRGADFFRLAKRARFLRCLVGVDVDKHALKEAKRRWLLANSKHDVAAAFVECDLDSQYSANRLCDQYPRQFHLVCAQFCVHYFLDTLPEVVGAVLAPNGRFVCTLLDGKAVRASLRGRREHGFKREWRIDGVLQTSLQLVDEDGAVVTEPRLATHVAVYVDTIGQVINERLVDLGELTQRMEGEGLTCVDRRAFTSFPSDFYLESDPMYSFSALYTLMAFQRSAKEKMPWED